MRYLTSVVLVAAFALPALAQDPPRPPTKPSADRKMGLAKPLVFEKNKEVYGAPLKGLKQFEVRLDDWKRTPRRPAGNVKGKMVPSVVTRQAKHRLNQRRVDLEVRAKHGHVFGAQIRLGLHRIANLVTQHLDFTNRAVATVDRQTFVRL